MAPLKEGYPEVYTVAPPRVDGEKKEGQLSDEEVVTFFKDGFLVVKDFFPHDLLERVKDSISVQVDDLAKRLFKAGKIKSLHEEKDFFHRLTAMEAEFPGCCVLLHKSPRMSEAVQDLWSHHKILNVVEQLVGPEVAGHPVWNLRPKAPHNAQTVVPWHQDNAYMDESAIATLMPTAWVPLLDATVENGCMQVIKGGHRSGKTGRHHCCVGGTWYVEIPSESLMKELGCDLIRDVVTCEIPFGGFLLFQNCVPHRSLPNTSDLIRWSLDLRWMDSRGDVGLWGLKDCLPFKTGGEKIEGIDWKSYHAKDRNQLQRISVTSDADEFDTTLVGPWMKRWELVYHNRHTFFFEEQEKKKREEMK